VTRRILLVDDDENVLMLLRTVLALDEFEVTTCTDGQEALDLARMSRPDVVVLDVMMPGLDGNGVLRALKSDPLLRDIPVVMLTARDAAADRLESEAAGCDAFLTKPFSPIELIEILNAVNVQAG